MGLSAFPSENLSMGETSMADSLAINPVQFRPAGGGGAATTLPNVFNSSGDRQERFWNTMGMDQNGVGREALGLGLGMAMGGMPLAGMGALSMPMAIPLGMGMLQQHQQQHGHTVNYGDKRELWSMLEGSAGAVVGVESLAVRNEHSGFFSTSLAAPPQSACVPEAQQKVVKSETEGAQMVPVPPQDSADRWDFDHHGEIHQNTQQQHYAQQQLQIAAVAAAADQNADPQDQSCGQQQSHVEDSEGQSIEERWNTWEEEKQQAKEASSKDDQENGNENENENEVVYFYRECQRNMAAEKGCTVLDGCGEFMPLAEQEEGKPNPNAALVCSACSCHRNFHRRVLCNKDGFKVEKKGREEALRATHDCIASIKSVVNEVTLSLNQAMCAIQQDSSLFQHSISNQMEQSFNPAVFLNNLDCLRRAAKSLLVSADCLTTLESVKMQNKMGTATKDGGNSDSSSSLLNQFKINGSGRHLLTGVNSNGLPLQLSENNNAFSERKEKRKRTRFSTEQITKLNDFAMEVGWTLAGLSKEDIDAVCENVGIEPTTLKYWLYNTRQKSKKRLQEDEMSQSVS